jgi:DNA-directed RNA polymerase subunit RPC12/RpoP
MNIQRFMTQGQATDGNIVKGLLTHAITAIGGSGIVDAKISVAPTIAVCINPDTIEPLAVEPANIRWVQDPAGYVGDCPNCGGAVDDDEIYGGEYCRRCGQRLDWKQHEPGVGSGGA